MRYSTLLFILLTLTVCGQGQVLKYTLEHPTSSNKVKITLEFDPVSTATSYLTIPHSAPGTYELTNYLDFIDNVKAVSLQDEVWNGLKGRGSFFFFRENGLIKKITYEVDILKMETELKGGFASSKLRKDYLGILGYSVFGVVSGLENSPIELTIKSKSNWPIFTTLKPTQQQKGEIKLNVDDYASLVDAQYLLGDGVQILNVKEVEIPLVVAAYSETPISLEEIGRRGLKSLKGLSNYFGYVPMPHYTLCYEFLVPLSNRHSYGFSMEHLNSMTASLDTSRAILEYDPRARIGGIVHHMGHSWIPLRSYGKGYRPFDWGSAPIIETIWLNEGFIWYVMSVILDDSNTIQFFKRVVKNAPDYIQKKSLKELSQLGSSQYSTDFNIGRNLFSRGALMAYELDIEIKKNTNNEKTFKDALLGLLDWTLDNQRGFEYNEIEPIMSSSTGVDLSEIWNKWQ